MSTIDWAALYVKTTEQLLAEKDLRIKEAQKIAYLEKDLETANTELLCLKQKLSPRGVIEFFQDQVVIVPQKARGLSPGNKWAVIYDDNLRGLKDELNRHLPELDKKTNEEAKEYVKELVQETYQNASHYHHQFDKNEGVFVTSDVFPSEQMALIRSICRCIPCKIHESTDVTKTSV